MKKYLFFCGPHCCGKTTMLKKLTEEGFLNLNCDEIGKRLFYSRKLSTAEQGNEFELEVTKMELSRDEELINHDGLIGIETWHPGNLAYASVRNPSCIAELCSIMKDSPLMPHISGVRLTISEENIFQRTKTFANDRKWASEFYKKIDSCLDECIVRLGLENRTKYISADNEFDRVFSDVKSAILDFV